jgi:hypothetical protein
MMTHGPEREWSDGLEPSAVIRSALGVDRILTRHDPWSMNGPAAMTRKTPFSVDGSIFAISTGETRPETSRRWPYVADGIKQRPATLVD